MQELAVNRVLREDEWNNLPSGLLDQVDVRVVVGDIFCCS